MASIPGFGQHCPQKQTRIHGQATHDWPRSARVTIQSLIVICDRRLYRRSSLLHDSTSSNHHWCPSIYFHLCPPPQSPTRDSSQALVLGVRRDRVVAKTIEPAQGGDPNITFAIFEDRGNGIAGESISLRKYVGASLMDMHNTDFRGSNPDAAIAVPEKSTPSTLRAGSGYECWVSSFPPPNRASFPGKGIKRVPSVSSPTSCNPGVPKGM